METINGMAISSFPDSGAQCLGRSMFKAVGIGGALDRFGIVKHHGKFCAVEKLPFIAGQDTSYRVVARCKSRDAAMEAARVAARLA